MDVNTAETKDKQEKKIQRNIVIKGARVHNLKNIDVEIPRNKLVVITGLSGSGKSSLAFDTLYAEGQRRYVESLSSYARQFMGRISKPDVDFITGISPSIAIEQKVSTHNPRSTVGTSTEIYDYLKLLYARVGKTFSPVSNKEVKRATVTEVVDFIVGLKDGAKVYVLSSIPKPEGRTYKEALNVLQQQGFTRIKLADQIVKIEDAAKNLKEKDYKNAYLLIDRFAIETNDEEVYGRISDSVQTAFYEGGGKCFIEILETNEIKEFSNKFEADGMVFEEPSLHFFSFNNPVGACKTCEGFGSVIGIDPDLVIPNKNISVFENAIVCWKGDVMQEWKMELINTALKFDFPIHRPINELSKKEYDLLWTGNKYFKGLNDFFKFLEAQAYKIQYRVMLSRYRGKTTCPDCLGTRIRKDAGYVKINNTSIQEVVLMQVKDLVKHFANIKLTAYEKEVAGRILIEIQTRLNFLVEVGLGYLTLNRLSNSLSGGESQRINLATSLGSSLVGSLYVLDEPSIGLHSKDTEQLIKVLMQLRNLGNTVVVVEHDEEIMRAADYIIDIGPYAGTRGGNVVFTGVLDELKNAGKSLTAAYLTGTEKIQVPPTRRKFRYAIELQGVHENNLKHVNVKFPLNTLCVVTGVSGSGKTSLVKKVLYPALKKMYGGYGEQTGKYNAIKGDYEKIQQIEFVDQNPIGKSSRSNPATYIKAYDEIRNIFAETQLSKMRGYKPSHFSFNVDGGRCEVCEGEGNIKVEMQFMADIELECDNCHGKRFKSEILEVNHRGKNIYDVLTMTVDDAIDYFGEEQRPTNSEKKLVQKLKCLSDVGLGYVQLGQSSSTLSGGEAQRIKLAFFLSLGNTDNNTLFIFDEPTTGLHFHDISKLLDSFTALLDQGHSIIIIEHNLEVIKCADWIIDIGPEGGDEGGKILFEGKPEDLVHVKESYTAKYLKEKLA